MERSGSWRTLFVSLLLVLVACGDSAGDADHTGGVDAGVQSDAAPSGFAYHVTVADPDQALPGAANALTACAEGGLAEWGKYLSGQGTLSVEIRVAKTAVGRFAGASTSNVPAGACKNTAAPCSLVEEQGIHRLRTGMDNPAMLGVPDVHIDVSPDYWNGMVWVDPAPLVRSATVPPNRLDCVSLFTHELGHAFGMTGFRSLSTFQPTSTFQSLYDDALRVGSGALTFEGPLTKAAFGPVPLTRTNTTQNVYHYGDPSSPSAFDNLLMNGISYQYGHRYFAQRVDVLILQDLGVPIQKLPAQ